MKSKQLFTAVSTLLFLLAGSFSANATSAQKDAFNSLYPAAASKTACTVCHTGSPTPFTAYGTAYMGVGGSANPTASMQAIENMDPDGDGKTFLDEINAGTIAPISQGTASTTGCLSSTIVTPLSLALAMLALGFFVRRKKD